MNMSLKKRIVLLSVGSVAFALLVASFGLWKLDTAMEQYKEITEVNLEKIRAILVMHKATVQIEAAANKLFEVTASAEAVSILEKSINSQKIDFKAAEEIYEKLPFSDGEEDKWKLIKTEFIPEYFKEASDIVELSKVDKAEDRMNRDKKIFPKFEVRSIQREEHFDALIKSQNTEIKDDTIRAHSLASLVKWLVPLLFLIGAVLSVLVSIKMGGSISRQISSCVEIIDSSSDQVATTSEQVASSSKKLSESATEQAASLGQTAAALEQISAMISRSNESASGTESSSTESYEKAAEGRKSLDKVLNSMDQISKSNQNIENQVSRSNDEMSKMVGVIQEIGEKTKVINEIVFQTKLLSFNAAVEAARAGEQGKGFAVVAEEVGNLAQMSGNAAKEITDMLNASLNKVENMVKQTKTSVESLVSQGKEKVITGVSVAKECSTVLNEIVENTGRVTELAQKISSASNEQSIGVGEINKAMGQLDSLTKQNSHTSEATAGSALKLSSQARKLKTAVDDLVLIVEGGSPKSDFSGPSSNRAA